MARRKTFSTEEMRSIFKLDTEGFEEDTVFIPDTEEEVWIATDEENEEIARFQMYLEERRTLASM